MTLSRNIIILTRPYWKRLFAGILLSFMASGITALIAWAVKPALDQIFVEKKYEYLKFLPPGIFLLFTFKGILAFGQQYLMRTAGMKLVRETRNRLFSHIMHLPAGYFSKESSGVIISRIISDAEGLNGLLASVLKTFVVEIPTVLFLLGLALYRRWDLTLVTIFLLPFIAYSTRNFGKRIKKKRKDAQRSLARLTQRTGETIVGIKITKIFTREEERSEKFRNENQQYYRDSIRVVRFKEFTALVTDMLTGLGIAFILWYGGNMVLKGTITAGDFASIIVAIYMIFSPVKKIGEAYTGLQETRASIERVNTLFDAKHEEQGSIRMEGLNKSLVFEDVSFQYHEEGAYVLKNVSFEIHPGEVLAIVGRSGVGKSTLIDLIPRFNRPTTGRITLDGTDLNDVDLKSLRQHIGIVSQDVMLFNDTIGENIAFGRQGVSRQEIVRAASLAYADEFIMELPGKYDTVIGERGLKLSGGQRQRIAIARAIIKNPPLLILDEATSSLDAVSEKLVQKALEELMKGRTTIVIAHRLSTIRNADRIVIFDKGRITAIGTHAELIAGNQTYKKLYNAFTDTKEGVV
jgi:subfamily B ATP-binding cassette protein MsbA